MNLHGLVVPAISAVNPMTEVTARISTGPSAPGAGGVRTPTFATPGAITASISGNVLTVSASSEGTLQVGQRLAGSGVVEGTTIAALGTGTGGVGTYEVDREQEVASTAMTTSLVLSAQIQPMSWRDIQQTDGLNLQGSRDKMYLFGRIDGLVRADRKGGDLITVPGGVHAGVWLVAVVLEQWPDWVAAAVTKQNPSS